MRYIGKKCLLLQSIFMCSVLENLRNKEPSNKIEINETTHELREKKHRTRA